MFYTKDLHIQEFYINLHDRIGFKIGWSQWIEMFLVQVVRGLSRQ
jgi:hypothetical protein